MHAHACSNDVLVSICCCNSQPVERKEAYTNVKKSTPGKCHRRTHTHTLKHATLLVGGGHFIYMMDSVDVPEGADNPAHFGGMEVRINDADNDRLELLRQVPPIG